MLQSRGDNVDGKQAGTAGETFIESFQREQGMSSEERAAERAITAEEPIAVDANTSQQVPWNTRYEYSI